MYSLGGHHTKVQRVQSHRWSRRPVDKRSHQYEYEMVDKNNDSLGDVTIEMKSGNRSSLSFSSPTRDAVAMDAWFECATALKDYDEDKIRGWKEEIDTQLVFAALFSALVTPFNIETYKQFPSELLTYTSSLNNPTSSPSSNTTVASSSTVSSSTEKTSDVETIIKVVNALWFCSLICSIASASISILVKQWLRQYTAGMAGVSPDIARLRQFRYDNLRKWKVAEIMMLLPILLQGSVVLFLSGLALFLRVIDRRLASAAIALIAALLVFILVTTILPTFKSDCPYQSPQAWGVFVVVQALKKPARSLARSLTKHARSMVTSHADGTFERLRNRMAKKIAHRLTRFADKPNTYSWKARERILVDDKDAILDQHMLVGADATFLDDTFLREVVRPCLNDMAPQAATQCYYDIMAHRADRVVNEIIYFDQSGSCRDESLAILTDITLDMLEKTHSEHVSIEHPVRILKTLEPLLVRSLPLTYDHFCRVLFSMLGEADTTVRPLAFRILYQQLSRNLDLAQQHVSTGCHDLSAVMAFINDAHNGNTRADGDVNLKHFLDACDLAICLATLSDLTSPDMTEVRTHLRDALQHFQDFFGTPLWKNDPTLLYPISRIAPHVVELQRCYPAAVNDTLIDVLAEILEHATQLNHNRNWEDMVIILETTLAELRNRSQPNNLSTRTLTEEPRTLGHTGRRPSLMRTHLRMDA